MALQKLGIQPYLVFCVPVCWWREITCSPKPCLETASLTTKRARQETCGLHGTRQANFRKLLRRNHGKERSQVFYADTYCLTVFRSKQTVTEKLLGGYLIHYEGMIPSTSKTQQDAGTALPCSTLHQGCLLLASVPSVQFVQKNETKADFALQTCDTRLL